MANFLHATDLGSDTDDEDYNPEQDGAKYEGNLEI